MKLADITPQIQSGAIIPYLGLEVFKGAIDRQGNRLPASSDEVILALNDNRPMPPRLMLEYPRAAMSIEQRRGRKTLEALFERIYAAGFEPLAIHRALAALQPPALVDTNRDGALQQLYGAFEHTLLVGTARIAGDQPRYQLYPQGEWQPSKPLLLKPLGALTPQVSLILSDADFVDWLTEAVAGFAVPPLFKEYRRGKQWLFVGCRFERDTDRMAAHELTLDHDGGYWLFEGEPTKAERRFADRQRLEIVPASLADFVGEGDGQAV